MSQGLSLLLWTIAASILFALLVIAPLWLRDMRKTEYRRISVLEHDPGYPLYCELVTEGKVPHIYVNGRRIKHALTADPVMGFVYCYKLDDGKPLWDPRMPDDFVRTHLHGHVVILLEETK